MCFPEFNNTFVCICSIYPLSIEISLYSGNVVYKIATLTLSQKGKVFVARIISSMLLTLFWDAYESNSFITQSPS